MKLIVQLYFQFLGKPLHLYFCTVHYICMYVICIGYIPRCRVLHDIHNRGPKAPRLCKSRSILHRGM